MPKRQDNNIRLEAENTVTQFVLQRHRNGIPGLPAQSKDLSAVSVAMLSKMTGVNCYRLELIAPLIQRLAGRYGLEAPARIVQGRLRTPLSGRKAAVRVKDYYENRRLPSRGRIAKAVGLTMAEIDSQECHDEITRLYAANGREWGKQNIPQEDAALDSYKARLREKGHRLPRLPGHREFDRQAISLETGIPVKRLWSRDLKNKLELFDPPEKRASADEIAAETELLRIFVGEKIRELVPIPKRAGRFDLTRIAHEVRIPSQRLHNVEKMRSLIRMWSTAL